MTSIRAEIRQPTPPTRPMGGGVLGAGVVVLGLACVLGAPVAPWSVPAVLAAGIGLAAAGGLVWWRARRPEGRPGEDATAPVPADVLATLLDRCGEAVAVTDPAGDLRYANATFLGTFGSVASLDELATILEQGAPGEGGEAVRVLATHPERTGAGEVIVGDGGRVFAWTSEPMRDDRGAVSGRLMFLYDLSQERELAALKSDFLSTVTHELRTPLTSVKGSLQLVLGKSAALTPIDRELLNISLKNSDRLIRMINDLLDISRLELGRLELSFASVPSRALVEEAVAGVRAYATGRDIVLACEVEPSLPAIYGDRDRLIQVLTNLVSNAIKFSPVGGRVLVGATRSGESVAIAVQDWGVGIRESDQHRLFRRFQRLDPGSSDEPGTGLGLAISKAIVDRHEGQITVRSHQNEGSIFTVVLPIAPEPAAVADPGRPDGHLAPTDRATVLLIDDDADLGRVLETSLGERYRLLRVERGVQALEVARAERPELILLDVVLPDLSGYDVLRILRHSEATSTTPVVMMTVQPERDLAVSLGAVDVIAKPVDIEALDRILARALRRDA